MQPSWMSIPIIKRAVRYLMSDCQLPFIVAQPAKLEITLSACDMHAACIFLDHALAFRAVLGIQL